MTKREARALAKARRAELDMQAVGCGMARTLFALPCWAAADTVLAFAAMPDEPDTAAMLRRALADGKRLLLPRVRSRTEMDWVAGRPGAHRPRGLRHPGAARRPAHRRPRRGRCHAGADPLFGGRDGRRAAGPRRGVL